MLRLPPDWHRAWPGFTSAALLTQASGPKRGAVAWGLLLSSIRLWRECDPKACRSPWRITKRTLDLGPALVLLTWRLDGRAPSAGLIRRARGRMLYLITRPGLHVCSRTVSRCNRRGASIQPLDSYLNWRFLAAMLDSDRPPHALNWRWIELYNQIVTFDLKVDPR